MGLCLGFSGLSLVELIYFFTLRAWWTKKRNDNFGIKILKSVINTWTRKKGLTDFSKDDEMKSKRNPSHLLDLNGPSKSSNGLPNVSSLVPSTGFNLTNTFNRLRTHRARNQSDLLREMNSPFLMNSANYPQISVQSKNNNNNTTGNENEGNSNDTTIFNHEIAPYYSNNNNNRPQTQYWEL